jgi:multimeric flavodoxin WrbA
MKILVISSSPRRERSLTLLLAKEVLKGCARNSNIDSEIVQLCDLKIDFCRHCEACHKNIFSCPIKDDVSLILKKMLGADGIILSSPNYINQVTASMKALFDRSSHFIHCKRIIGKYIAGVVTSGSGQDKDILDYLEYYAHVCGAQYSGGVSSRGPISKEKMEEAFILGNKLASDIQERKIYPGQIEIIDKFKKHIQKIMQIRRGEWEEEYEYWQNKGWL